MFTIHSRQPSSIELNQGSCHDMRIPCDQNIKLFQGNIDTGYNIKVQTIIQHNHAPRPTQTQDKGFILPEQTLSAINTFSHTPPLADANNIISTGKRFEWNEAKHSLQHYSNPLTGQVHNSDFPIHARNYAETLLKTIWGVYCYYYHTGDQHWTLNIKSNPSALKFYRQTMFF